ncbi:hypothetical protein ACFSCX_25145, partial [Bacillus salitolerans]
MGLSPFKTVISGPYNYKVKHRFSNKYVDNSGHLEGDKCFAKVAKFWKEEEAIYFVKNILKGQIAGYQEFDEMSPVYIITKHTNFTIQIP